MLREEKGFSGTPDKQPILNTSLIGFLLLSSLGLLALSAAVLLPEYVRYVQLRAERDLLAFQVSCDEKLALYHDRTIRAVESDPILISRLLIRLGNYRPVDCKIADVQLPTNSLMPVVKILQEAQNPPDFYRGNRLLLLAGQWIKRPFTNRACIIFGLIMLSASVLFFGKSGAISRYVSQPGKIDNYANRTSTIIQRYRLKPAGTVSWRGKSWTRKAPAMRKVSVAKTFNPVGRMKIPKTYSLS
ncbi:MAG: hypothetical protein J7L99_08155 [Planctomycetes bacterium]|nr:hypothetical protein [Planctomycetota bacterium]